MLAVTQEGHRVAARSTSPRRSDRRRCAWRADSARVVDTPLIDFILEVERKATGAQLASTAAFSLDASLAAGPITISRLAALYPYDNTLRAVRITGAQLRAYLEQSARYFRTNDDGRVDVDPSIPGFNYDIVAGVDYTIDVSKPIGERITQLDVRRPPGRADRHVHDGAQQLSPDGRRRLRDAARRAGGLRSPAGDPPAADRRSARQGHADAERLFSSELAHRAGGCGRRSSQINEMTHSHGSCVRECIGRRRAGRVDGARRGSRAGTPTRRREVAAGPA